MLPWVGLFAGSLVRCCPLPVGKCKAGVFCAGHGGFFSGSGAAVQFFGKPQLQRCGTLVHGGRAWVRNDWIFFCVGTCHRTPSYAADVGYHPAFSVALDFADKTDWQADKGKAICRSTKT